jgi:hypothetical protein
MLTKSFYTKLNEVSADLGMNPRDLLLVIALESGGNPAARNPNGGATGLIQFMPATLKSMGLSQEERSTFGQKSAEQQLDYVKQYVKAHQSLIGGKPFTSATQYYVANFFPIALKKWNGDDPVANRNVVVASENSQDPRERAAYKANPILDANKDGKITVGDLTTVLMNVERGSKYQELQASLNSVAGEGAVSDKTWAKGQSPTEQQPSQKWQSVPQDQKGLLAKFLSGVEKLLESSASRNANYLIRLSSNVDLASKLEFARVLSMAANEELSAKSEIFTNGDSVEIQCATKADMQTVVGLCEGVKDAFSAATKKIGELQVNTVVKENTYSRFTDITPKLAEIGYRKFHLKFALENK